MLVKFFNYYVVEDLGDLALAEFELESIDGGEETWTLEYITISDIQRGFHWYFPFHKTFRTNKEGYDHNVLLKEHSGGNK